MYSAVGKPVDVDGDEWICTDQGQSGYVLYGPYEVLPPGRYAVKFEIRVPKEFVAPVDQLCCVLDATSVPPGTVAERTNVFCSHVKSGKTDYFLTFNLSAPTKMEFRVEATGYCPMSAACKREVVRLDGDQAYRFAPVTTADLEMLPPFFVEGANEFRSLYEQGVNLDFIGGEIYAVCEGVRVRIENNEDIQVLREVFIAREYNFIAGMKTLAVDIGMNVGLASLFLASSAWVQEVHSFEPFAVPAARARRNLELNPQIAGKIHIHAVGLSDHEGQSRVLIDPNATIGTSIAGTATGEEEVIAIRNASSMLRPLLAAALAQSWRVFVKIDCEGSEFAILDDLSREGLLGGIDAIACEWHKWWDGRKTQFDLFHQLFAEGFVVFDATRIANPHAGTFYAVRRGDGARTLT